MSKLVYPPEKPKKHLEQHFAEHDLPGQPNIHAPAEHPHVLKQLPHPDNQDPLSHLEVKNAISKLKNAMTMGLDGLREESLKYDSSDKLLENLCRLIFEVRDGEKTCESWRISRLTYLWKWKGSSLKPAKHTALNYRIIEQTDHYNEARSNVQGLRIQSAGHTVGFRNGVRTQDATYVARRLTDTMPGT